MTVCGTTANPPATTVPVPSGAISTPPVSVEPTLPPGLEILKYDVRAICREIYENNRDHMSRFTLRVQGIRRLGSAALDLCYIASGRVDGYWEIKLEAWDLAAGALIAREAGALVSKIDGQLDLLTPPYSIVAANPALHPAMLEVLQLKD